MLSLPDEPGVGVDPISRRDLWRMVRELVPIPEKSSPGLSGQEVDVYMSKSSVLKEPSPQVALTPRDLTFRRKSLDLNGSENVEEWVSAESCL